MERKRFENGDHSNFLRQYNHKSKHKDIENDEEEVDRERSKNEKSPSWSGGGSGHNYIEHRVSKMDTLAGVAIKYGVEVSDVKRMNGLVTDLQMFALKTLQIPLPGRHPPSPNLANCLDGQGPSSDEQTPPRRRHSDLFDSLRAIKTNSPPQKRVSPAMSSLQGYYGIKPAEPRTPPEGFEMSVYRKESSQSSPLSNPPLSLHRKSKSVANGLHSENGSNNVTNNTHFGQGSIEKFRRRRQKSELDLCSPTPELLMEDNSSSGSGFSTITGKGLALRPKTASRTSSGVDPELEKSNYSPVNIGDSLVLESLNGVRKSSSTSSLQDQESCTSSTSSIWPTAKWSLKPDLQALSAAAIARPIFDGLPKPITGRKNKAALD